ncbi:MAG: NmrA family NAD(P)-binding protein [Rubripirellula sp.]
MKILVYGANGSQTGAGTQILMDRGHEIRVLIRSEEKAQAWKDKGAEVAIGHMDDLNSLVSASEGCDAIFLLIPTFRDTNEEGIGYGVNAIKAAKSAGISKVIWNTAGPVAPEGSEQAATDPGANVVKQMNAEGMTFLGLQPTFYMENFLGPWTLGRLQKDDVFTYPIPANFKANWVTLRLDDNCLASHASNDDPLTAMHHPVRSLHTDHRATRWRVIDSRFLVQVSHGLAVKQFLGRFTLCLVSRHENLLRRELTRVIRLSILLRVLFVESGRQFRHRTWRELGDHFILVADEMTNLIVRVIALGVGPQHQLCVREIAHVFHEDTF